MAEKSGLPTIAAISGVNRSFVSAVITPPKAAPITTPTAISTTFPRRMNFLKPSSIGWTSSVKTAANLVLRTGKVKARRSDAHGHHDVPVLVVVSLTGPHLPSILTILQL